jgi:hypothetical protein
MGKGKFKGLFPFPAKTFGRAFLLNSIAIAITTGLGIFTKYELDKNEKLDDKHHRKTSVIIGMAFATALVSYAILYLLFGFGRGMMA